ncbi:Acyl-CoA-binding protein, ACBP [Parasponia andersonii]|uniref:Acyl-CoA-binding protein, ACBP n=1 Tax=Parasponia andersonii TaxID=3476 RepID=A0A2P5D0A2_PARAD|nr:Acyl-CoA-binding protein, ACBP [Parasponia andersonii]
MELFLELASTIFLTVLLCYIIGKLISSAAAGDGDSRMAVFECKLSVGSEIRGLKSEGRVEFVEKVSQVEESGGEPAPEKSFAVRGFPDGSFGSPGLRNVSGTEEEEGEGESVVEDGGCGGNGGFSGSADNLFEESSQREGVEESEVCLRTKDEMGLAISDEIEVMESDEGEKNGADDLKRGLFDEEEDDWVGIERTELERLFGAAMVYVGSMSGADRVSVLDNDVKMKLYGLHKITTQGPCLEPQPMALKVSARAKW